MFIAQGVATLVGALVQSGLTIGVLEGVNNVCTPKQSGGYTCPHGAVTYSSSLIWGALGPGRNFSSGQIYGHLLWFFLVGPLVVLLTWALGRKWKFFNYIAWPVVFGGMSLVPPATGINFSSWFAFNAIFNGVIKRRRGAWWSKYSKFAFISSRCLMTNDVMQTTSSPQHSTAALQSQQSSSFSASSSLVALWNGGGTPSIQRPQMAVVLPGSPWHQDTLLGRPHGTD